MTRATVTYCGLPLSCAFEYEPAEPRTWDHPGSPANASLTECWVGGVDIFDLLTREQQDEIETLLVETVNEEQTA